MKWAYVIVNYNTFCKTQELIASIEGLIDGDRVIIVVDSGSTNIKEFAGFRRGTHPGFVYIGTGSNLGYAKAANVGIARALQWGAEFVAILNSDVVLVTGNFETEFVRQYESNNEIAVMGPSITTAEGVCQSPLALRQKSIARIVFQIVGRLLYYLFPLLMPTNANPRRQPTGMVALDVVIHGSCFVLTPGYLRFFKGLYSRTFMYYEEYVLYELVVRLGLHTFFCPEVCVIHDHGAATRARMDNSSSSTVRFRAANQAASLIQLLLVRLIPLSVARRSCG